MKLPNESISSLIVYVKCKVLSSLPTKTIAGHSDGYVSFLNETLLFLAEWDENEYNEHYATIKQCWPNLDIVKLPMEVPYPHLRLRINKLKIISKCIEFYEESRNSNKGSFSIPIKF